MPTSVGLVHLLLNANCETGSSLWCDHFHHTLIPVFFRRDLIGMTAVVHAYAEILNFNIVSYYKLSIFARCFDMSTAFCCSPPFYGIFWIVASNSFSVGGVILLFCTVHHHHCVSCTVDLSFLSLIRGRTRSIRGIVPDRVIAPYIYERE